MDVSMDWKAAENLSRSAGEFKLIGSHYKTNYNQDVHMDQSKKTVTMDIIRLAEEELPITQICILTDW